MIEDQHYMFAFFASITVLIVISVFPLLRFQKLKDFPEANLMIGTVLLLSVSIFFIGFRNPYGSWRYLGDTYRYTLIYQNIQNDALWVTNKDFGFYYYMKLMSNFFNIQTFYFITALLYILPVYYAFNKWLKKYAFFAVVLLVTSLSFWPFGINGMRNGLATSIFIFALAFKDKRWLMYSFIALSISFHTSMFLPTIALIITEFYSNTKLLLRIWFGSIFMSLLLGKKTLSLLSFILTSSIGKVDQRADFSGVDSSVFAKSSFRIDFIIYSALVVCLGYYFIYKIQFKNKFYRNIFNLYIVSNTFWLYFIYFPYTNRIAYLSWFLIPILVVYPIVYISNLKNQSYFISVSIAVSLFLAWMIGYL